MKKRIPVFDILSMIIISYLNYKLHKYGFWDFFTEKTSTLPLSGITDMSDMSIEIGLKEIKRVDVDESEFVLPSLPRVESPDR